MANVSDCRVVSGKFGARPVTVRHACSCLVAAAAVAAAPAAGPLSRRGGRQWIAAMYVVGNLLRLLLL